MILDHEMTRQIRLISSFADFASSVLDELSQTFEGIVCRGSNYKCVLGGGRMVLQHLDMPVYLFPNPIVSTPTLQSNELS